LGPNFIHFFSVKIFFLLNPSKPRRLWDLRDSAARAARPFGWTARFGEIDRQRPRHMDQLLTQAAEEGCRRVVAVGGDGTLHQTLNALRRLRRLDALELGVVPAGTCNDFARAMGLQPRRLAEALRAACGESPRPTDVGRMTAGAEDALFINNAGFGRRPPSPLPSSALKEEGSASAKEWPRGRAKALKTLRSFASNPLNVRWERGQIQGEFFMGMACNAPFFSRGLYFSKNSSANDGLLDVYLLPRMPRWRLLPLLLKGKLGRPIRSRHMIALRAAQLEVESETDLWPQADGEPAGRAVRKVAFSVFEEKAMVVFPKHAWLMPSY